MKAIIAALTLFLAASALHAQQAPVLAMVMPQTLRNQVLIDDQPLERSARARAGSRITASEDAIAGVGLTGRGGGSMTLLGVVDEQASMYVGGTDFSQKRTFQLKGGALIVNSATATESIEIWVAGRTLALVGATCLIRVKNGGIVILVSTGSVKVPASSTTPPIYVTENQWLTLGPGDQVGTPALATWPEVLEPFGLGSQGKALVEGMMSPNRPSAGAPWWLKLLLVGLFAMQLLNVVYPQFGDRAVAAAIVALGLEAGLQLSRVWLNLADSPLPAGAFLVALVILGWVLAEEAGRQGRPTTVRAQFISYISKCVLIVVLATVMNHGPLAFHPNSQNNVTRMSRTQYSVGASNPTPVVTNPPQKELQSWEALAMVLPALYLMVR